MWGNFCTVSSDVEDLNEYQNFNSFEGKLRNSSENDVHQILQPRNRIASYSAPLFGPPRKYGQTFDIKLSFRIKFIFYFTEVLKEQEKNSKTTQALLSEKDETESHISSIHIVEDVNVTNFQQQAFETKIQDEEHQRNKITSNNIFNDDDVNSECSSDNDETLHSEILNLCNQIENANEQKTRDRKISLEDLTCEEKKLSRNIIDKVKYDNLKTNDEVYI